MTKSRRRPVTGEKRKTNQPLKIDRLCAAMPEIREAIQFLRNVSGKPWEEIEEQSALPYSKDWKSDGRGFVNWEAVPTSVLELFPDLRLPHTNLHRWYDLRVDQVIAEASHRAERARELAAVFAKSVVKGDAAAVLNAARDQILALMAEDNTPGARLVGAKFLIALAQKMQTARLNDLRERKVSIDERRVVQLEKDAEVKRRKFQREMDVAEKKITKGQALTADDINRIRERVFGIGPTPVASH